MSAVYAAGRMEALAAQLLSNLAAERADPFRPRRIIVPHSLVRRWLEFVTAQSAGIAMNVHFDYLEFGLWRALAELAPDEAAAVRSLDGRERDLLILHALRASPNAQALSPLLEYLDRGGDKGREKRLWQLCQQLSARFLDYEYHRPEVVRQWLEEGGANASEHEAAEREVYRAVFGNDGQRDRYAGELEQSGLQRPVTLLEFADKAMAAAACAGNAAPGIHVFAITPLSETHLAILAFLAAHGPVWIYQLSATPEPDVRLPAPAHRVLAQWNKSDNVNNERLTSVLLSGDEPAFKRVELDPNRAQEEGGGCDLHQLQGALTSGHAAELCGDGTVRILAAPSVYREAEAIRDDIIVQLRHDQDLSLHDVVVLAADPEVYMPVLRAVFDRGHPSIPYHAQGYGTGYSSHYAAGVASLLEIARGRLSRDEVLPLTSNPCFLTAHGLSRDDALVWEQWVTNLGVYHSWNQKDREGRGYGSSYRFTWEQGLRRLRLGTVMAPPDDFGEAWAGSRFAEFPAYRDLQSADREAIAALDSIMEPLLTRLADWRTGSRTWAEWAEQLADLVEEHLRVPYDHLEEASVASQVRRALRTLEAQSAAARDENDKVPLELFREVLLSFLSDIREQIRSPLDGITILPLRPPLAIPPFKLVYIVGLNERAFPGVHVPSGLDYLRPDHLGQLNELTGPDHNLRLWAQALLATRKRLCLSYLCHDLQKDESLSPSPVIPQLLRLVGRRFAEERSLMEQRFSGSCEAVGGLMMRVPLHESDERYLNPEHPAHLDGFSRKEQALGAVRLGQQAASPDAVRIVKRLRSACRECQTEARAAARPLEMLTLRRLALFLEDPAKFALDRHLRAGRDIKLPPGVADEPFYSVYPETHEFHTALLNDLVARAVASGDPAAAADQTADRARKLYDTMARAARAPEGALGEVDFDNLMVGVEQTRDSLLDLLRKRSAARGEYYPRLVLGGSARRADGQTKLLPAVRLELGKCECEIRGEVAHVWLEAEQLHVLHVTSGSKPNLSVNLNDRMIYVPHRDILQPFLLYLALRNMAAGKRKGWIGQRTLVVHVAARNGIATWRFGLVGPSEAGKYLRQLVAKALDPQRFEVLPLDFIAGSKELLGPLCASLGIVPAQQADDYRAMLIEALDADIESLEQYRNRKWRAEERLRLIENLAEHVPEDPLSVLGERLGLLLRALNAQGGGANGRRARRHRADRRP